MKQTATLFSLRHLKKWHLEFTSGFKIFLSLILLSSFLMTNQASGQSNTNNSQWGKNGPASAPVSPVVWANGNAQAQNSHFVEGQSIPTRLELADLTPGVPASVTFNINIVQGGDLEHAFDFFTGPNRIAETVQPTDGITGTNNAAYGAPGFFTFPIPSAANVTPGKTVPLEYYNTTAAKMTCQQAFDASIDPHRNALWFYDCTVQSITYEWGNEDGTSTQQAYCTVNFTPNAGKTKVLFALGCHIAAEGTTAGGCTGWGVGHGATNIGGSPYHFHIQQICSPLSNCVVLGSQDQQMAADAVCTPPLVDVTGNNTICSGASTTLTAVPTPPGTYTYQWSTVSGGVATPINGATSSTLNVSPTSTTTYRATVHEGGNGGCDGIDEITVTVNQNPVALVLTGSSICASNPGTGTVTSSTSQTGVSYQLKDAGNANVQAPQAGTGAGLTWSGLAAGTYHVVSAGAAPTNCPGSSNTATVTSVADPVALVLTGSSICASNPGTGTVTSSTSQTGVSYQLKDAGNANVQSAKAGTGAGLTWSGLAAGTYHVVSAGAAPTSCPGGSNTATVTSVANPVDLVLTGSAICDPGTGTVSSSTSQTGVSYQLKNGANADVQAPKAGTGAGLTWTGLSAGTGYHVVSTGAAPTSCPGGSNSVNVTANSGPTISAGDNPAAQCRQASIVNGVLIYGTNTFSVTGSNLTNATLAVPAWSIAPGGNPSNFIVNIVTPNSLTTNVQVSGAAINGGSVTLRITANSNATPSCGTATDDVTLTLNPLPDLKTLQGSNYCPYTLTPTGTVTLLNSQIGVTYQLYDDGSQPVQGPRPGTGNNIQWTGLGDGGYTAVGTFDNATACNSTSGPATVIENAIDEVTITPVPNKCNTDECVALVASPTGGTFSGDGVVNGQFCPNGLAPGQYTVTYSYTNTAGCTNSSSIQISVASCAAQICTYTQGYFGNAGGLSSDGTHCDLTTTALINQSLGNWAGTYIRIGYGGNYIQINDGDAACIIEVLPGGGPAKEVTGANQICTLPASMLQNGRIHNVLVAQTIALGLNIGITSPSVLGDFGLQAGTLATAEPDGGCGSSVPILRSNCTYDENGDLEPVLNDYTYRTFSQALIDAIEAAGYTKTVGGLFSLANDAIGNKDGVAGTERGVSLSEIAGAAGSINEIFDECRISQGWIDPCPLKEPAIAPPRITANANAEAAMIGKLKVTTYPNPYRNNVRFVIQSPVSGQAILDVYNIAGQKVQTLFNGHVDANETRIIDFKPSVANGMMIYTLRIGNQQVTGKLIGLKQ